MTDLPPTSTPTDPVPYETLPAGKDNSWMATTSAACGGGALLSSCLSIVPFVSCVCCPLSPVLGIAGIVFGILGMKSPNAGLAKAGLGMSIASFVVLIVMVILSFFFGVGQAILQK